MLAAFVLDPTLEGFDETRLFVPDLRFVCEVVGADLIAAAFEDAAAHTD
jgi:hypothetical protein